MQPVLTLIIPTYNCESCLREGLDSVFRDFPEEGEVIAVDDGSSDGTLEILSEYGKKYRNLTVIPSDHKGASAARNTGLDHARGKYVSFMDCDDCIREGFYEKYCREDLLSADLYIFGIERIYYDNTREIWSLEDHRYERISDFADDYIKKGKMLIYSNCNKLYRRSIIEDLKLRFDEGMTFGEDRLFNYRFLKGCSSVFTSGFIMYRYFQRSYSSMSAKYTEGASSIVSRLTEAKIDCFLSLAGNATEEEKNKFAASCRKDAAGFIPPCFRFTIPDTGAELQKQRSLMQSQTREFMNLAPLKELFSLLGVDADTIGTFNARIGSAGSVKETMELDRSELLQKYSRELFPFFRDLGFMTINKPLSEKHSHILVLGGSLEVCFTRTLCAARWADSSTRYIDGLSCYRPVSPRERKNTSFPCGADTEFGALCKAFSDTFSLSDKEFSETFVSDRNLNGISNIRSYSSLPGETRNFRIFAAPSSEPGSRRANTADTLRFYLENTPLGPEDSILAITNNRYCNRQFLQLVHEMYECSRPFCLDVIGCTPDENIPPVERYDPNQLIQDLIGVLELIKKEW